MTSSIRSWWTLARQHAVGFAVAVVLSAVAVALPVTESHGQATSLTPASEAIMLEAGKGMLLRLEGAAASVFVADAKIADIDVKSSRLIYLFGVTPGETTLYAVGADDSVLASVEVQVSHNIARLQSAIRNLAPNSTVDARSLNGSVILSGMALSAAEAEEIRRMTVQLVTSPDQIINQMRVASPNQINLRVKVAEVSREVTKNLGFSLDAVGTPGGSVIGLVTGLFTPGPGGILGGRPSVFETFSGGAAFGNISPGSFDINGLIDALEEEGLISVLAEPNLTALSGETASFLAGGEFPIPVPQSGDRITIQFKNFGVSLAFTPTLLADGRINLRVRPEVSQLSVAGSIEIGGLTIPALTTRRAETTVELGSGQSFAIAGLLQNNTTHDLQKFPGLGDIPILGTLFRSTRFQRDESELVIIVTPYIVQPSNRQLALPTDGLTAPSDYQRIVSGQAYSPSLPPPPTGPVSSGGNSLAGPAGFILY